MPQTTFTVEYSLTEIAEFQRLVFLLEELDSLARVNADDELRELVDECREDLAARRATPRRA